MALTDSLIDVTTYIEQKLEANKATLGLQDVFLGDQDRIPRTPTACVEPGGKTQSLDGAPRRVAIFMEVYVILYHTEVRDVQQNVKEATQLAEATADVIHQDDDLGGSVIHNYVTDSQPGYVSRGRVLMRATRITVQAQSKVQLP